MPYELIRDWGDLNMYKTPRSERLIDLMYMMERLIHARRILDNGRVKCDCGFVLKDSYKEPCACSFTSIVECLDWLESELESELGHDGHN